MAMPPKAMTMPTPMPTEEAELAELARSFNLFDVPADYLDAPEPWMRLLREHDPMHDNADGTVLLTRYHDVRRVWRDRSASVDKTEMFRAKFGQGPLLHHHTTSMLFRDPPDHDRLRALVMPLFTPRSVARFSSFIEDLVARLLDEAAELGELDIVTDFARKVPVSLITRILGVPPEDGEMLRPLGLRVLFPLNPSVSREAIDAGNQAVVAFTEYMAERVRECRRRGIEGEPSSLVETLVAAEAAGDQVSEDEMLHICLLLFNGGHETTTNMLSLGTLALLEHPDQYALVAALSEDELPAAVDEILRYVTPLQLQGRRTTKELDLPTGPLAPGTEVVLCQASANRDDRAFSDPDRLDLRRVPENPQVAFGMGVHACVGNQLARLEGSIIFTRLAQRFPELEMAGRPVFNENVRFRGLQTLPVRVGRPRERPHGETIS
jgi:cytochrome P450